MATRRKRTVRKSKSSGHPFLLLLFFLCLITGSAYVTDRMTNAPDAQVDVAAVRHVFNDKEMQGLVPKEDQGTPESWKEKIKAAFGQIITIEMKSDEKTVVAEADTETGKVESAAEAVATETKAEEVKETKSEAPKEEKEEKGFLASIFSSKTEKEEKVSETPAKETKAEAAPVSETPKTEAKKESVPVVKEKVSTPATTANAATAKAKTETVTKPAANTAKAAAPVKKPATVTGRLVVVIDDAGRDLASQKVYENMGIPLTLAVMPNQVHTREAAISWHAKGLPVILHQPMESVSGMGMEKKVILTSMSDAEIRGMLKNSLSQVPEAIGINNHQGSKATTDKRTMEAVMNELSHRGLFFFDSRTNSTTAADAAAKTYGVRYARNDLFVDNSAEVSDICRMIREGAERAKKHGTYIIIGHCRPNTAEAFRQMVPKLLGEGIQFVYLKDVER